MRLLKSTHAPGLTAVCARLKALDSVVESLSGQAPDPAEKMPQISLYKAKNQDIAVKRCGPVHGHQI
jgi:hypothetical protein